MTQWSVFVTKFASHFPAFKGPGLMKKASPYFQQVKSANSITFTNYGINADGKYIEVLPHPSKVPTRQRAPAHQHDFIRKRPPTNYNWFVYCSEILKGDRYAAMKDWSFLAAEYPNQNIQQRFKKAAKEWRLFYKMLDISKQSGYNVIQHLEMFEGMDPMQKEFYSKYPVIMSN